MTAGLPIRTPKITLVLILINLASIYLLPFYLRSYNWHNYHFYHIHKMVHQCALNLCANVWEVRKWRWNKSVLLHIFVLNVVHWSISYLIFCMLSHICGIPWKPETNLGGKVHSIFRQYPRRRNCYSILPCVLLVHCGIHLSAVHNVQVINLWICV